MNNTEDMSSKQHGNLWNKFFLKQMRDVNHTENLDILGLVGQDGLKNWTQ